MASLVSALGGLETFPILAHQGGWDEILLVATPLAFIGLLLWIANRRVKAQLEAQEAESARAATVDETERREA